MNAINLKYEKGTRVLLELEDGDVYEGDVVSSDDIGITLINLSLYPDKVKLSFPYKYYRTEITSIRSLNEGEKNNALCNGTDIQSSFIINDYVLSKYNDLFSKYMYMANVDERYHQVVKLLKANDIISVAGIGSRFGRHASMSFMAVANKTNVYIFDIKQSGTRVFDLGIRGILECNEILKIVHNGKSLADCLCHCHNVKLANVYDTQIADIILYKKEHTKFPEKVRKFSELVNTYLNLPKSIIEKTEVSVKTLSERPISKEVLMNVSMLAVYLLAVYRVTQSAMFEDFNKCVQCYLGVMKDAEGCKSKQLNTNNVPEDFKKLKLSS